MAYNDIPVYAEKYRAIGFRPGLLKSWADFEQLPIMSKDELIAAYPDSCVAKRWPLGDLFSTRSFGTSGKNLPIKVNQDAILTDTLQGVRQFWLQSGLKFTHMGSSFFQSTKNPTLLTGWGCKHGSGKNQKIPPKAKITAWRFA